jgi:hypothetical protein
MITGEALNSGLDLLSARDLATIGGATSAVVIVTNGCFQVFRWNPKVVGLISSVLSSLLALSFRSNIAWQEWILVIPNAFLVYFSAIGASGVLASIPSGQQSDSPTEEISGDTRRPRDQGLFFRKWY